LIVKQLQISGRILNKLKRKKDMSIRLASNCSHCESLSTENMCSVHKLKVNENYTCDRFSLIFKLDLDRDCNNCLRNNTDSCAHPQKAAEGMLCSSWAPQAD